jgi:hypothetical protein
MGIFNHRYTQNILCISMHHRRFIYRPETHFIYEHFCESSVRCICIALMCPMLLCHILLRYSAVDTIVDGIPENIKGC